MKTLAELKRDAKSGKISFELMEWFGKVAEQIPERLRGIRTVSKVNTVGIYLRNGDGQESEMRFESANVVEYDGENLTLYRPGYRDLTDEEQNVLAKWKAEQAAYEKRNPYGNSYWKMKEYFQKCACPWMEGFDMVRGKKYDFSTGKVIDNSVKGDAILKYRVYVAP